MRPGKKAFDEIFEKKSDSKREKYNFFFMSIYGGRVVNRKKEKLPMF